MGNAIIFDADGILLLSTEPGIKGLQSAAVRCGLEKPSFQQIKNLWGQNLVKIMDTLSSKMGWTKEQGDEVLHLFIKMSQTEIFYPEQPALVLMLSQLRKRGFRLGVVSNRDYESLAFRFEQHRIPFDFFEHVHTAVNGNPQKPDPAVFNRFTELGFNPRSTLVVGDSVNDDLAAALAHQPVFKFAGVISGVSSRLDFMRAGLPTSRIFKSVSEIPAALHYLL